MRQNVNLTGGEIMGKFFSIMQLELHADIMFIKLSTIFSFHEIHLPTNVQMISLQIVSHPSLFAYLLW